MQLSKSSTNNIYDVVIVGAGMAGLRAAQVLRKERPNESLLILEARPVAGGRIRWTRYKDAYMDDGAQYIHGSNHKKHPIVKLAQEHGIPYRKVDWDDGYLFVGPQREELSRTQERKEEKIVAQIEKKILQWQSKHKTKADKAISLDSILGPLIDEECEKDDSLSSTRLKAYFHMDICDDYATELNTLSAHFWDHDEVFGDTDSVPDTYQRIVEAVLEPVQDCIQYNHAVERITFSESVPDDLVEIICRKDEADERIQIMARRVISSLPLGVLKQKASTLFQPSLPPPLQESIQRLGFGCLEKVWLTFSVPPFWPTDVDVFYHGASETPYRVWFIPSRAYRRHPSYERMLCCFVSGTAARELAQKTASQVGAEALEALKQILEVPLPASDSESIIEHVHVSKWSIDPFSGNGSYSYMAVGATPSDVRIWEQSFYNQRLWFAGEATHSEYPSTVHGAFLSGERAGRACSKSLF